MPPAPKRSKPAKSEGNKKAAVRVPRACDNCRLRKSKCDGLLPCSFCQQHDSECTYDESRPKKQLDTKYIVSLERTVDRLKEIVGIPPEIEVTSEILDEYENNRATQSTASGSSPFQRIQHAATQTSPPETQQGESPIARTLLESMVEATGRLNIDEDGNYDYSGNSSGLILVERIRQRCDQLLNRRQGHSHLATQIQRSPSRTPNRALSHPRSRPRTLAVLPSWEIAVRYTNIAFMEAFSLFNFIHRPTFESRLRIFYSARNAGLELSLEDIRFEALLYAMFALGEAFSGMNYTAQDDTEGRAASEQYFIMAQQSLDMTDCRDISSLQALLCSVIYLQGSGQVPSCYTYLSLAMTAAVRMGLHRADSLFKFDPLEREVRKRIFWTLRAMDSYVTTVLDLPRTINDEDTDQEYPLELEDRAITSETILEPAKHSICQMSSVNAHTRLGLVLVKAKNITSGVSDGDQRPNNRYQVDYAKIVEAEQDLIQWTKTLPSYTKLPDPVPKEIERAQLLLRVAHGHVQMVLYRPFLHHIARKNADADFDYRAFACASACIKAAMQVVWLVQALDDARLLNGPSWLLFFTLFMAVVILTLFVITNKDDPTTQEYYSAAQKGFLILERFASYNQTARTYTESLRPLFRETSTARPSLENELEMNFTPPNVTNPNLLSSNVAFKSPNLNRHHNPSSIMFTSNALHDVFLVSAPEPMTGIDPLPSSITLPSPTVPSLDDPSAQNVYVQAMNCTPTNFFEGFSSETAMMDYFSWHEQDAELSNSGFQFQ